MEVLLQVARRFQFSMNSETFQPTTFIKKIMLLSVAQSYI